MMMLLVGTDFPCLLMFMVVMLAREGRRVVEKEGSFEFSLGAG